jgi:hypothetical protein
MKLSLNGLKKTIQHKFIDGWERVFFWNVSVYSRPDGADILA